MGGYQKGHQNRRRKIGRRIADQDRIDHLPMALKHLHQHLRLLISRFRKAADPDLAYVRHRRFRQREQGRQNQKADHDPNLQDFP